MNVFRASAAAALLLLCTTGCQHVAPAPAPMANSTAPSGDLRSPWDTTPIQSTDAPFACANPVVVSSEVTVTGPSDSKQHVSEDVKAAVYQQSTTAVDDMAASVVAAADAYRNTGSARAAACAIRILAANAAAHAMTGYMASEDAGAHRSYALRGISIAYLKVRPAGVRVEDATLILDWFEDLVKIDRDHYAHSHCDKEHCYIHNHKGNSVAAVAAIVGVAANDPQLFHWAVGEYHSAVGEINSRGMLYYDTKNQGKYAFKDNLRSTSCLVQIAELAEINNVPLYGYDNGRIHLLVHTVALGLVSTEPYHSVTREHQWSPSTVEPWMILWASVYNRRFPDPLVTSLLQQVGPASADMWGGEPWSPEES